MTSEIDKLKHFHVENYSGTNFTDNKNPICWGGGLFEHKDNVLTGRYFSICLLQQHDINKECPCLKGIRLEDVTVELEEEAYEEMRNNK